MQGDFSRLTFDPRKHYRSVRMQQGRVQLDADWNEQIDILNHYFEMQLRDLLGASGAMSTTAGFQITAVSKTMPQSTISQEAKTPSVNQGPGQPLQDLLIKRGNYYVDGMLCENEQDVLFSAQPYYPGARLPTPLIGWHILYLDVWQRHITAFEDASLREIALGGPDTTTRTQLVWQVRMLPVAHKHNHEGLTYEKVIELSEWRELLHRQSGKTRLAAQHVSSSSTLDNQLYRVEIHHLHDKKATFKWSRENGSQVFEVEKILSYEQSGNNSAQCILTLSNPNQDMTQFQQGDWVEFVNDEIVLSGHTWPLYQVTRVSETEQSQLTLTGRYTQTLEELVQTSVSGLLIRRWDHGLAAAPAEEAGTQPVLENTWIDLERGIQIKFSSGGTYNVGDYWLIPSRALSNDIEWPTEKSGPLALPPCGVDHHFCPLALVHLDNHHRPIAKDLRRLFAPLTALTEQVTAYMKRPEEIKTEVIEQIEIVERNILYEECNSQDELLTGDLVSFIPGTNLEITRATRENAKLLFGVVSAVTEVAGEKRFRVTTYGRARCKVAGTVEAGDLLTVAEEHGHATKSGSIHEFLHAGSLVGKALEAYAPQSPNGDGSAINAGTIDILVSLQ